MTATLLHTLYYSPAASSLAVHIALEEVGVPHDLARFETREGRTRKPEYLAVNPLGQVPALRLPSGDVLTEVLAVLFYVADLAPGRALLPTTTTERARALSWMSFLATSAHGAFRDWYRPASCVPDEAAQRAVRDAARSRYFAALEHVESCLSPGSGLLGEAYSLCDAQAFCFYFWGQHFDWPVGKLPRYRELAQRVADRPATQRALAAEGFTGDRQIRIA